MNSKESGKDSFTHHSLLIKHQRTRSTGQKLLPLQPFPPLLNHTFDVSYNKFDEDNEVTSYASIDSTSTIIEDIDAAELMIHSSAKLSRSNSTPCHGENTSLRSNSTDDVKCELNDATTFSRKKPASVGSKNSTDQKFSSQRGKKFIKRFSSSDVNRELKGMNNTIESIELSSKVAEILNFKSHNSKNASGCDGDSIVMGEHTSKVHHQLAAEQQQSKMNNNDESLMCTQSLNTVENVNDLTTLKKTFCKMPKVSFFHSYDNHMRSMCAKIYLATLYPIHCLHISKTC